MLRIIAIATVTLTALSATGCVVRTRTREPPRYEERREEKREEKREDRRERHEEHEEHEHH